MAAFVLLLFRSQTGFVFLLDHANLLFHEAGHPLLGLISSRLEPYGGTTGQLVFPLALFVSFWRKGEPFGVAASAIWLFENFLNIAHYVADARAMELPLVGGGEHDWNTILSRWNLLASDMQISGALKVIAWIGITSSCGWIIWRALQDSRRTSPQPETLGV
jgi:hypothetical protein